MISFLIGAMVGGTVGIIAMCLLQINHNRQEDNDLW